MQKEIEEVKYNEISRNLTLIQKPIKKEGEIAICTGGTGDIPVAEEAAVIAITFKPGIFLAIFKRKEESTPAEKATAALFKFFKYV
ncbi:MAG: hypothetical protein ACI37R_03715 [Candidatus Avigastranaerophilus sp.]